MGQYVRYADWRFVFKARLNTIGLNGNNRWDASKDPKCRHCGYEQESLPHVVSSCPRNRGLTTLRHNAAFDRIDKGIPRGNGISVRIDRKLPGSDSLERPNIVVLNDNTKTTTIRIFEGEEGKLEASRERKIEKYQDRKAELEALGYKTALDAIVVGSLGTWHSENDRVVRLLAIDSVYADKMRKPLAAFRTGPSLGHYSTQRTTERRNVWTHR